MTESAPVIQGWCPGALRPMESGDGWVVRIRPRAGRLTPEQARGIATLATRFGDGQIDISARANVQLRGVTAASHTPLVDGLRSLDLLDDTPQAEGQRNVILSPFWDAQDGAYDLALALSDMLIALEAPRLPSKFGFAVDMGGAPALRDIAADIRIERSGSAALIYAQGARTSALAPPDQAADIALRLAQWFADSGGIGADGRGRMASHLDRGAALPPEFLAHPVPPAAPYAPRLGPHPQGTLIAFEFGQMQAQTFAALADIGPLRITPWRMVLVEGAAHITGIDGLITQPEHPSLRVIACTGAPACTQAHGPTRDLARQLARHVPIGKTLHVSGCAKGCAHPKPADLTLTATPHGFDLVRAGRAGDTPNATRLTPALLPQALHAP